MHWKNKLTIVFLLLFLGGQSTFAQGYEIKAIVMDDLEEVVPFANVVLYDTTGTKMLKTGVTDLQGNFSLANIEQSVYNLLISFIGKEDYTKRISVSDDLDLGILIMRSSGIQIETAVVTARRSIVEVKADKTVFNVEGTINSAGENALGLLRKAPGVMLDNNNNINVLGRSGVKIFINGKKLPLAGEDLTIYLENLSSEQIDRIDIITNPGAKYEAEGNAGIIDIRLKKAKEFGSNGNIAGSFGQGRHARYTSNLGLNTRSEKMNIYGNLGYNNRRTYMERFSQSEQNDLYLDEFTHTVNDRIGYNGKIGLDYFLDEHNTIGFLVNGGNSGREGTTTNRIEIAPLSARTDFDSILVANNLSERDNTESTFNLNYVYLKKEKSLNIDADYGRYRNEGYAFQPNRYFDPEEVNVLTEYNTEYETPVEIDIYTFKIDYEQGLLGGKIGIGTKFSKVVTDNTYLFYEFEGEDSYLLDSRSNNFRYDENVYAAYFNYNRPLTKKINFNGGVRVELTDAFGELTAFDPKLQEDPVEQLYTDVFPSMGLSYQIKQGNSININYGRRLNRPNYNVLNPFKEQESELSFRKGNPYLNPEIVNNYEIGYTHAWRYNVKFSYSHTTDQITRLIGPDDDDPRAGFLSWDNLASQDVFALNFALPFEFTNWWNAFFNLSGSYINNQADYGGGAIVDLQAWSYNVFSQHTFNLPYKLTAEVSGWYSGPGIWGGVFEYDPSFSLNLGLQRKFLREKLNVKVSANDIFHQSGWSGKSIFNGLVSYGRGYWDSRRIDLNVSYKFGDAKVKKRQRKTGIEAESKRIGD